MSNATVPAPQLNRQRGAGLLEVLISVLIVSLGLLAMAGMHSAAVRYGKLAEFRASATQLIEDYADRMKSNPTGVRNGNYVRQVAWTASPSRVVVPATTCTETCVPAVAAAQVAAADQAQWINSAIDALPSSGLFAIRTPGAAANASAMDVWVMWQEPTGQQTDAIQEAFLSTTFTCPAAANAPPSVRCTFFRFTL